MHYFITALDWGGLSTLTFYHYCCCSRGAAYSIYYLQNFVLSAVEHKYWSFILKEKCHFLAFDFFSCTSTINMPPQENSYHWERGNELTSLISCYSFLNSLKFFVAINANDTLKFEKVSRYMCVCACSVLSNGGECFICIIFFIYSFNNGWCRSKESSNWTGFNWFVISHYSGQKSLFTFKCLP